MGKIECWCLWMCFNLVITAGGSLPALLCAAYTGGSLLSGTREILSACRSAPSAGARSLPQRLRRTPPCGSLSATETIRAGWVRHVTTPALP